MQTTVSELAALIDATIEGDPAAVITAPAKIEEAGPGTITFLGNLAYESYLYTTTATAILVNRDFEPRQPVQTTLLRVDDVYQTVSQLLAIFGAQSQPPTSGTIDPLAAVADAATLQPGVSVGKFSVISPRAEIGAGTTIGDQVFIGPGVKIGKNCHLYPGVRVLQDCVIGDDCILHANAVIGGDGFGFAPDPDSGRYEKIPQIGNVVLHDRVEVGAGTTIDRATMGSTVIHEGVKLDNLIQIAHNVVVGPNTVIAAMAGIAGSAKIGANCQIGGQVGIGGHVKIADGTRMQAQTGVTNSVRQPGRELGGSPHMNFRDFMRSSVIFRRLPQLISELTSRLKALEEKANEA